MGEVIAIEKYRKALLRKVPEKILTEELGEPYIAYRKRWHDAQQFEIIALFPINLDIELSCACNLKCVMCPHGDPTYVHPDYKGKGLDTGRVKKIIR